MSAERRHTAGVDDKRDYDLMMGASMRDCSAWHSLRYATGTLLVRSALSSSLSVCMLSDCKLMGM